MVDRVRLFFSGLKRTHTYITQKYSRYICKNKWLADPSSNDCRFSTLSQVCNGTEHYASPERNMPSIETEWFFAHLANNDYQVRSTLVNTQMGLQINNKWHCKETKNGIEKQATNGIENNAQMVLLVLQNKPQKMALKIIHKRYCKLTTNRIANILGTSSVGAVGWSSKRRRLPKMQ